MSSRQHIESYLDYYLNPDVITDFAVAVSGAWGSGKTTFIKKYLKDTPHIYVSLHGLTSVSQIESEIFAQLHPIRNSKTAKVAKKILAGSLKASLKIDLDGDGNSDGSLGVGITPEALEKFAEQSDSHVYVFDDIERSQLGSNSVEIALGYINQLTEHLGIKVIALWNDEVIEDGSLKIAEKTIGQSFTLEASTKLALKDFIDELSCSAPVKEAIRAHESEILLRFNESDVHNLRSLRQAVMDCQRILESLKLPFLENNDLIGGIIRHAIILKVDQRAGRLQRDDLRRSAVSYFLAASDEDVDDKQNQSWEAGCSKRHRLPLYNLTLSKGMWERIVFDGYIDKEQLHKEATPFVEEQEPNKIWREVWPFEDLSQAKFEKEVAKLISSFQSGSHTWDTNDFLQSAGVLIELANNELIEATVKDVCEIALARIAQMNSRETLAPIHVPTTADLETYIKRDHSLGFDDSSEGKAVRGRDSDEYKTIRLELFKKQREAGVELEKENSAKLLEGIKNNTLETLMHLAPNSNRQGGWYNYAVLRHLKPSDLIEAFENNSQQAVIFEFGRQLVVRYKQGDDVLVDELEWLKELRNEVENYRNSSDKKLFVFQLGILNGRMIKDSIDYLEKRKSQMEEESKPAGA